MYLFNYPRNKFIESTTQYRTVKVFQTCRIKIELKGENRKVCRIKTEIKGKYNICVRKLVCAEIRFSLYNKIFYCFYWTFFYRSSKRRCRRMTREWSRSLETKYKSSLHIKYQVFFFYFSWIQLEEEIWHLCIVNFVTIMGIH